MLPAQTFPGFRLTLPDCRDPELDMAYDFITAESAEGAEKPHAEAAEGAE